MEGMAPVAEELVGSLPYRIHDEDVPPEARRLLAVDLGLRTGLALYDGEGRLRAGCPLDAGRDLVYQVEPRWIPQSSVTPERLERQHA